MLIDTAIDYIISASLPVLEVCDSLPQWCVLHTRSHCEQLVHDQLVAKGFQLFLPKVEMWSRQAGIRKVIHTPLFPGYLFLHHRMEKCSYIEVRKARGLVNILRERGDKLAVIPDAEIDSIRTVVQSQLPVLPHPYLREGQKVRIVHGPLAGTEGILLQTKTDKGLLILSVNLLQRSIAVKVDCTAVEAV
jgi:transcription termination/antitermination protein NusG